MAHQTRPTLPPIHTLNLPRGEIPPPHLRKSYHLNDKSSRPANIHAHASATPLPPKLESQLPVLTSTSSQGPPPDLHLMYPTSPAATPTDADSPKIRLVPTTFEKANGVVLVHPRTHPLFERRTVLLVGPTFEQLRRRQYPIPPGSHLCPYFVMRIPQPGPPSTKA